MQSISQRGTFYVLVLSACLAIYVAAACPSNYQEYGGHCYIYVETDKTWRDAKSHCNNLDGAYLVEIGSSGENAFVRGLYRWGFMWIGLRISGNRFRWDRSGDWVTYTNWNSGEPSNSRKTSTNEDCVELRKDQLWNDQDCNDRKGFVCEKETITCSGKPPAPANGVVQCRGSNIGSVCTSTCRSGYEVPNSEKSNFVRCNSAGSWVGQGQSCTPISCSGKPPAPANGVVQCTGSNIGSVCTSTCRSGYEVPNSEKSNFVRCNSAGSWVGQGQSCTPITCSGKPPAPANGVVQCTGSNIGSVCTSTCRSGYEVPNGEKRNFVRCNSAGSWVGQGQSCTLLTCSVSIAGQGIFGNVICTQGNLVGSSCSMSCDPGYTPAAPTTVTCLTTKVWSGTPSCKAITCSGKPPAPANGAVQCTGNNIGSMCTSTCSSGYVVPTGEKSNFVTCNSAGNWVGLGQSCTLRTPTSVPTTPPTTQPTTTLTFCADANNQCQLMAGLQMCTTQVDFMRQNCAASCKLCSTFASATKPTVTTVCAETDSTPYCPRMAIDGKCSQPDVQKYCKKSCLC